MRNLFLLLMLVCIFNCDDIVGVNDISDNVVTVLAPVNNTVIVIDTVSTNLTFNWETLEDADAYQIQIVTPSFENATQLFTDSIVSTTQFSRMLMPNDYEWSVRALNSEFATEYTTQSFTIEK